MTMGGSRNPTKDEKTVSDLPPLTLAESPEIDVGTFEVCLVNPATGTPLPDARAWAWRPTNGMQREIWVLYKPGAPGTGWQYPGAGLPDVYVRMTRVAAIGDPPGANPVGGIGPNEYNAFKNWVIGVFPGATLADLVLHDHEYTIH